MLMKRIVSYMEDNLGNSDLTIDDIAQAVAMSRTSLHRKMKQLVGTSPMEFLREARIRKAAKMSLKIHYLPLVLYSVGDCPVLCLKQRLKYFGSLKPQA